MNRILAIHFLACLFLAPTLTSTFAQDKENKKPRKYKHDFEGQDLSGRNFSKQNLDDANFADAVLKDVKFENCSLKNCNFQGATWNNTNFADADLTGSDLRNSTGTMFFYNTTMNKVDLTGVDLQGRNTHDMKFREAKLRGTKGFNQIYGTDFYMADLRGADLSSVVLYDRTNFRKAKYDETTRWPANFDVKDKGMVLVPTAENEDEPTDKSSAGTTGGEAAFQKLDKNEDGVLSGSEAKGLDDKDANSDGEISMAEFVGKGQ